MHAICNECLVEIEGRIAAIPARCPHCGGEFGWHESPVHNWFELSYAQYLTVPRSIMEAMPHEWQERMVACLEQLDSTFNWRPQEGRYWCQLKDGQGHFVEDPLMQYRHPDFDYIESLRVQKAVANISTGAESEE